MHHDCKQIYLWDGMKKNIEDYLAKCPNYQQFKAKYLMPGSLTQIIEVLTSKLEDINIDFVVGLPKTRRQHASIWVFLDRMTKSAYFIPVKSTYRAEYYAKLYIDEIVRLHRIPLSIISYRGDQFTSHFWGSF